MGKDTLKKIGKSLKKAVIKFKKKARDTKREAKKLKEMKQELKILGERIEEARKRLSHLSALEKEIRRVAKLVKDRGGKERKHVGLKALGDIAKQFKVELRLVNHLMDNIFERG